ncbi:tyrosine--tRNA ligase [Ichthyobacterium seriolicida]|uniref:Tyrosine--tRNA ligase n=1 Tax=Ichthyobacterium seriolicida TaxID=242600 RepID=A0A1J1E590_9FLAO|nr:tyrosine--tRNA ligase [Ichthyobacterium seriolicida]BAV94470.1 tyrosyl-tRNA synthetase [Ichthyobacterium seriolicida]
MRDFIEELSWRGMIQDKTPGVEEQLKKEITSAYLGIDPTSDSLHIGHLVGVIMLKHFQKAGHIPIALLGGATGMIGDPSGKSKERNLLDEEVLRYNQNCIKEQLTRFLDFSDQRPNAAQLVNNYDWVKDISFLDFIRDIGKHITVNYMMSKESVRKRISSDSSEGMSFTEFTYQLVQGLDFLHLYKNNNCKLQIGGSDQWGNITTGTELIRRKTGGEAFAITCPLITNSNGMKFGKTEEGNIWLDRKKTSPYKFYQFWLNISDQDAEKYLKIFTSLKEEEVLDLIKEHRESPNLSKAQKVLAVELTTMVHSREDCHMAIEASEILFGKSTYESLQNISEERLLEVFQGVPQGDISKEIINDGIDILSLISHTRGFVNSNSEARRAIKENSISVNKKKIDESFTVTSEDFLQNKYILLQRGKKNYFVLRIK